MSLHRSKAATTALLLRLTNRGEGIVLIEEPWSIANKVCRLGHNNYGPFHAIYVGLDPAHFIKIA